MEARRLLVTLGFAFCIALLVALSEVPRSAVPFGDRPRGSVPVSGALADIARGDGAADEIPCPTGDLPPPVEVTAYRGPDGDCLPLAEAVSYRCTAGVPSTLVLGDREFVGALATPADPAPRQPVATADGTEVVLDPAGAGVLVTAAGAPTERWPEVPTWTAPSGEIVRSFARPHVFVVGDSVLLGAADAISLAFADWGAVVDAAVNRSTGAGLEVLRARRAEVQDVVVLSLGYNDGAAPAQWAAQVTATLDELADVELIVWLTLREARDYYVEDNRILRELAATRPNVVVADWNAVAPPEGLGNDGLHLNATGAAAMTGLINYVVRTTLPLVGRGDQSCRPAIDAVRAG
jgi:hypothetical protein